MYAIEFLARIRDGLIEIPEEYREQLPAAGSNEEVRVSVLTSERKEFPVAQPNGDLIEQLLAKPLEVPGFTPLSRDDTHVRNSGSQFR